MRRFLRRSPKPMTTQIDETWTFPFCPQPPDWALDWDGIVDRFAWVQSMKGCPQDPIWHAEGNVLIHTHMVCEALIELDEWRSLAELERSVVFAATLMHDIAKPEVTREENGRIRAPRHASKGAQMVRSLMLQELLPTTSVDRLHLREQVVNLVRLHGMPLYLLDGRDPQRELFAASQVARCDRLAIIALADVHGRHCADKDDLIGRVDMFQEFAAENKCLNGPRRFVSDHTRLLYFQGRDLDPNCEAYDETTYEVVVMSGLPGSGKDHWIARNRPDWPVISLDRIRSEMSVLPADNQGVVVSEAKTRAREYLRKQTSFIWNATNTSSRMRRQLIQLFLDYNARARIVYVEASWDEIQRRNRSRENQVPNDVLQKLVRQLDVPNPTEAHSVEVACTSPM